jgi:hypothetical protein
VSTEHRVPYGCAFFITTRCHHRCRHCYLECDPCQGIDMPDEMLDDLVERAWHAGLLRNVTIVGGEPFLDVGRLLGFVRRLVTGYGVLEIFIPTNGRWVLSEGWCGVADQLAEYGRWVPYELRVAFSHNQWNLEQLGPHAGTVLQRWAELETVHPHVFRRRTLGQDEIMAVGRARKNSLAAPGKTVGAHCSFDDWVDRNRTLGFHTDFLSFWPDGSLRCCFAGGPTVGQWGEDLAPVLDRRATLLGKMRVQFGKSGEDTLSPETCSHCVEWAKEQQGGRQDG